jgi:hypothetical protein
MTKRYQRGKQKSYIRGHTIQWPRDTKEVNRSRRSKDRQYNDQEILVIVLSVLWFTTSVYLFGISWSLYCLSSGLRLLFTSLVSLGHCIVCPLVYDFCLPLWFLLVIVLSVLLFMTSVYLFGISWSLYCLSSDLWRLFTSLVSLGHCIVCPLVYDFCLSLGHCIVCPLAYTMTKRYQRGKQKS